MIRDTPFTQPTTYANGGPYTASINEASYDRGVEQVQQLQEIVDRCFRIAASDTTTSTDATEYLVLINAAVAAAEAAAAIVTDVYPVAATQGAIVYGNGASYQEQAIGAAGQVLGSDGSAPVWQAATVPGAHASTHENGGVDEINVAGLSGVLADTQVPSAHGNASHNETFITAAGVTYEALAAAGDVGTVASTVAAGDDARFLGNLNVFEMLYLEDRKVNGTNGGTSVSGVWTKRDLNTEVVNTMAGASLSSSIITLPAGTYWCTFSAPANGATISVAHQARLRQTDGTPITLAVGSSETAGGPDTEPNITRTMGADSFVLAAEQTVELQHLVSTGRANDGFGSPVGSGEHETYAQITIFKVS
jgi:hypothetical protein